MKAAAVFPEKRDVKVIDYEGPKISQPNEVKIRILDVGVCGTDKEICAFAYGTPPPGSDYLVLGHESLGEVVEVGTEVSSLKPGNAVVPMVRRPCPHEYCFACRSGRQDFCFTGDFTERGIKQRHGFMTEFVVDDEQYLNVVPDDLRDIAVLVEPLTIAEKALIQVSWIQQRLPWGPPAPGAPEEPVSGYLHRAVVLGAGPVGLLGAMLLVKSGFQTHVYSREQAPNPRADLVASIGAKYISSETVSVEQLATQVGNIDLVYEATGASRMSFEALKYLGANGVFVFTGVPGRRSPAEVDTDLIMRNLVLKNQVVLGTVNAGRDAFQAAIRDLGSFLQRWPNEVRALITKRYPLEGFRELVSGEAGGIKNVVSLGERG